MDDIARRSLLFDFYGSLLTEKQRDIYDWYYQQDLSLGEIAELQKVSRPAVYDLIKRTDEALFNYEDKLGLVERYDKHCQLIKDLQRELENLEKLTNNNNLSKMRALLDRLHDNW